MNKEARRAGPGADASPASERRHALPPAHPAAILATLVATLCVLLSVTFKIFDPDLWQHLAVGRAIWQLHRVPTTQLWIWPTHGLPDVTPSWAFRALLWPFWTAGGVGGLFAWRWVTTLAAFGFLWGAARRMGARGLTPLVVIVLAALTYRHRSQVRPETLVAVLLAAQVWILETRRSGGGDRSPWLIAIAWAWANVHISYTLGFVVLGAYIVESHWTAWRRRSREDAAPAVNLAPLWFIVLAALAVSFANPSGWRGLWQPFDYWLHWRHEPLYFTVVELRPILWSQNWSGGLPLLMVGWPVLILWRVRSKGVDLAEAILCVFFTWIAITSQRFVGFYALIAVPFVSRDLAEWLGSRRLPVWCTSPAPRAGLVAASCIAIGALEWSRADLPLGVGFDWASYPVKACDFIAAHGVRGRGFNEYYNGGYVLWRFWPERDRLPFMDIHQSGTDEDRKLYPYIFANPGAWIALDARYRFDYALLDGSQHPVAGDRLLDFLDSDSTWALVFRDDNAALYLRRDGPLHALAESTAFVLAPGGNERLERLGPACERDSVLRYWVQVELARQINSSPYNSRARSLLANFAIMEHRFDDARRDLQEALRQVPTTYAAHERLGVVALAEDRAEGALREFELQDRAGEGSDALELHRARAYEKLGRWAPARDAYRKYLAKRPGDAAAKAGLQVIEARLGGTGRN